MKNGSEATEILFYRRILLSWTEKKEAVLKTTEATGKLAFKTRKRHLKCLQHIAKGDVLEKLITGRIEGQRSKENSE